MWWDDELVLTLPHLLKWVMLSLDLYILCFLRIVMIITLIYVIKKAEMTFFMPVNHWCKAALIAASVSYNETLQDFSTIFLFLCNYLTIKVIFWLKTLVDFNDCTLYTCAELFQFLPQGVAQDENHSFSFTWWKLNMNITEPSLENNSVTSLNLLEMFFHCILQYLFQPSSQAMSNSKNKHL